MTMLSAAAIGVWQASAAPASHLPGTHGISWMWGWYLVLVSVVLIAGIFGAYGRPPRIED